MAGARRQLSVGVSLRPVSRSMAAISSFVVLGLVLGLPSLLLMQLSCRARGRRCGGGHRRFWGITIFGTAIVSMIVQALAVGVGHLRHDPGSARAPAWTAISFHAASSSVFRSS